MRGKSSGIWSISAANKTSAISDDERSDLLFKSVFNDSIE